VPAPGEPQDAVVSPASVGLVAYSISQAVTFAPFGLTVPFNVAEELVTDDAEPVRTVGGLGSVVKLSMLPSPLLPALLASTR